MIFALTDLTIIASASREETQDWVRECGAHHVVDHRQLMAPQLESLGTGAPGFVFSTTHTGEHLDDITELIAPQGRFGLIDDLAEFDIAKIKRKAVSLHWEFMFTRPLYNTPDIEKQSELLNRVSELIDEGKLRTTLTEVVGKIDSATLKQVHSKIESGAARGKIVLEGF